MVIQTDVVIVGAGPCGLFQVFELGLLGLKAHVVDSIKQPGGQCTELYPDKPIYDIPAVPVCTGEELTDNLLKQIEPFGATMHLGEEVTQLERTSDDRFHVTTSNGTQFDAGAVVIAAGVGSFQPRQIRAENVADYEGTSIVYRVRNPEQYAGKHLVVFGGGDSALDWLLALQPTAQSITLVHRRDEYRGVDASVAKMRALAASGDVTIIENAKATAFNGEHSVLQSVDVKTKAGEMHTLRADHALVFFGLAPKLGPIADWGLDINRKTINVDTEKFETNEPGIFAVGDINFYPGKKKLILSGFHEAALAAFAIKARLEPGRKVHLQYTTTSPVMHERLGINDE
ncbi:MAG: NAD(P)/FAD-dependent oxidoreductase [Pseudomonadota bacterium]